MADEIKRVVLWVILAATCACIGIFFLPNDPARERIRTTRLASADERAANGLAVRAWLEQSRVYRGDGLSLRFIFENHAHGKIAALRFLDLQTPGFDFPKTWTVGHNAPGAPRATAALVVYLDPGQSESIETRLQPTVDSHGVFSITALFGGTSIGNTTAEPHQDMQIPISVGPVEISTPSRERIALFMRRAYSVGKDLTLPLLLAILAYLFQKNQKELETRESNARDARETRESNARDERDRRQQVWNSQLPRLHENAERHYMPMARSMRVLLSRVNALPGDPQKRTEEEMGQCLYYFLLVLRRWKHLRDKRGAVFFKDREGEKLVQLAWWVFNWHVEQTFTVSLRDRALKEIAIAEEFDAFQGKLGTSDSLKKCREIFGDWSARSNDFPKCMALLKLLRETLSFETNRPFDGHWYSSPAEFEVEAESNYEFPAKPEPKVKELKCALTAYYDHTKQYLKEAQRSSQLN